MIGTVQFLGPIQGVPSLAVVGSYIDAGPLFVQVLDNPHVASPDTLVEGCPAVLVLGMDQLTLLFHGLGQVVEFPVLRKQMGIGR